MIFHDQDVVEQGANEDPKAKTVNEEAKPEPKPQAGMKLGLVLPKEPIYVNYKGYEILLDDDILATIQAIEVVRAKEKVGQKEEPPKKPIVELVKPAEAPKEEQPPKEPDKAGQPEGEVVEQPKAPVEKPKDQPEVAQPPVVQPVVEPPVAQPQVAVPPAAPPQVAAPEDALAKKARRRAQKLARREARRKAADQNRIIAYGNEADEDSFAKANNEADFLVTRPAAGSVLSGMEKAEDEGHEKTPVFETHSFFDGIMGQSCYIGLRYTKKKADGSFERKRVRVGFGSGGSGPIGQGRLSDQDASTPQASTETPITVARFNQVVTAVENTQNNIENVGGWSKYNIFKRLFGNGKGANTEFSGKYNALTNNSNDFVIAMARAAGVAAPEMLHKSIWGPKKAVQQMMEDAATTNANTNTRVFLGGGITNLDEAQIEGSFDNMIREALQRDNIDISMYPELDQMIGQITKDVDNIRLWNAELRRDPRYQRPDRLPKRPQAIFNAVRRHLHTAMAIDIGKKHANLNKTLMKVDVYASRFLRTMKPIRTADSVGEDELKDTLDTLTEVETNFLRAREQAQQPAGEGQQQPVAEEGQAGEGQQQGEEHPQNPEPPNQVQQEPQVQNPPANQPPQELTTAQLLADGNINMDKLGDVGELIYLYSSEGSKVLRSQASSTDSERLTSLVAITEKLEDDANTKVNQILTRYIAKRAHLSSDQIAKLLTLSVLCATSLSGLVDIYKRKWTIDQEDEEAKRQVEEEENAYVRDSWNSPDWESAKQHRPGETAEEWVERIDMYMSRMANSTNQRLPLRERQKALAERLAAALRTRIDALRAAAQPQQPPQPQAQA